jgi:hypothetical protein
MAARQVWINHSRILQGPRRMRRPELAVRRRRRPLRHGPGHRRLAPASGVGRRRLRALPGGPLVAILDVIMPRDGLEPGAGHRPRNGDARDSSRRGRVRLSRGAPRPRNHQAFSPRELLLIEAYLVEAGCTVGAVWAFRGPAVIGFIVPGRTSRTLGMKGAAPRTGATTTSTPNGRLAATRAKSVLQSSQAVLVSSASPRCSRSIRLRRPWRAASRAAATSSAGAWPTSTSWFRGGDCSTAHRDP